MNVIVVPTGGTDQLAEENESCCINVGCREPVANGRNGPTKQCAQHLAVHRDRQRKWTAKKKARVTDLQKQLKIQKKKFAELKAKYEELQRKFTERRGHN